MATPTVTPQTAASLFFTGAHSVRADVEKLATANPPRGFVVGPAGSGKSNVLRDLHDLLVRDGLQVRMADDELDIGAVPASEVLLVDNLATLSPTRQDAVLRRAGDPDAALVAASRPWPRSATTAEVSRRLESSAPVIVLGQVTRADLISYRAEKGQRIPPECLDDILTLTGGISWLVSHALSHHDEAECRDAHHAALRHVLEQRIAHRLDSVDDRLRRTIQAICLGPRQLMTELDDPATTDDLIAQGYAEGLLLRNGRPVPVVSSAVRAAVPVHRIVQLSATVAEGIEHGKSDDQGWLNGIEDARIGSALAAQADRFVASQPQRAADLYQAARASGLEQPDLTLRQAQAAWATGDLDTAASFADAALADDELSNDAQAAEIAASVWAARGMMSTASEVYLAIPPHTSKARAVAAMTHAGAGQADPLAELSQVAANGNGTAGGANAPSTLNIAMRMLGEGLQASLATEPPVSTLTQLVRASELFTSSRATDPLPELPAVIAAAVAVGAGDLKTARSVIDSAIAGGQGGSWAVRRLLLVQAWLALQGERLAAARESLAQAEELRSPTAPRDELLRQTILVSLARRYGDVPALEATWYEAIDAIRHVEVDLYTLLPLSSLIAAAARVGDATTLAPHLARGLEILRQLGSPPLWSTHLRWAGVQQGILLNKPDSLAPHARALVAAARHNHVAETMAHAGGIWVAVLAGTVDADAVEAAARALAEAGLAWDGARLASHGARKTDDRKVATRLLACARELHPPDSTRRPTTTAATTRAADAPVNAGQPAAEVESPLSEREMEVARLVLQGKTYAEIGQTIYISPRTVEHHIAHMKRRLSASSRSDLIGKLRLVVDASTGETP